METTNVLTEKERKTKAIAISKMLLESKRQSQANTLEQMKNPNSLLRKQIDELKKENERKGHPYAL